MGSAASPTSHFSSTSVHKGAMDAVGASMTGDCHAAAIPQRLSVYKTTLTPWSNPILSSPSTLLALLLLSLDRIAAAMTKLTHTTTDLR